MIRRRWSCGARFWGPTPLETACCWRQVPTGVQMATAASTYPVTYLNLKSCIVKTKLDIVECWTTLWRGVKKDKRHDLNSLITRLFRAETCGRDCGRDCGQFAVQTWRDLTAHVVVRTAIIWKAQQFTDHGVNPLLNHRSEPFICELRTLCYFTIIFIYKNSFWFIFRDFWSIM